MSRITFSTQPACWLEIRSCCKNKTASLQYGNKVNVTEFNLGARSCWGVEKHKGRNAFSKPWDHSMVTFSRWVVHGDQCLESCELTLRMLGRLGSRLPHMHTTEPLRCWLLLLHFPGADISSGTECHQQQKTTSFTFCMASLFETLPPDGTQILPSAPTLPCHPAWSCPLISGRIGSLFKCQKTWTVPCLPCRLWLLFLGLTSPSFFSRTSNPHPSHLPLGWC